MLTQLLKRSTIGLCLALLLGLLGGVIGAKAQPALQEPSPEDCQGCHTIIGQHWSEGSHGRAANNEAFLTMWNEQGNPPNCMACHSTGFDELTNTWEKEGVDCTTCHSPIGNHPDDIMPTDNSSRKCGECHLDTYAQWQTSTHGVEDLSCTRCHNSHTTELKAGDVQELCQACHLETAHFFAYTPHAQKGLLCTDCHVSVAEGEMGEGHGRRTHTFEVSMETCTDCHSEGLHFPIPTANTEAPAQAGMAGPLEEELIGETPQSVSPIGFAILGTLIGMAFGMLLAPWLERWYSRFQL